MPDKEKAEPEITNKHREDWNNYVLWLEKIGMKGDPRLDEGGLGNQLLQSYIKDVNPKSSLSVDIVAPIQKDLSQYREWSLSEVKAGRRALGEGVTEDNFLKDLSIVDGYAGHKTTSYMFPRIYMEVAEKGKKKVQDQGFSTTATALR